MRADLPYLLPALLLNPLLYWNGYHCWFQLDDFAWLGLLHLLEEPARDLPRLLLEPMAQGTIRPLSERGFFLAFRWLFDLWGAPYHALVFLTQSLNLVLLYALVRRLGGERVVAGTAAVLWCSNSVLAWPLAWVSAYNQVLISTCFLAASLLWARGSHSVWGPFLAAFGVLELAVVLPALLLLQRWRRGLAAMFGVAVLYAAVHSAVAPKPTEGIYAVSVDARPPVTFARYAYLAVWPEGGHDAAGPLVAAGVAVLLALQWRNTLVQFGVAWFFLAVSVYLVVPNHISAYYLVAPAVGLAIALAAALHAAPRWAAALLLAVWLPAQWAHSWHYTSEARRRSVAWETIMTGTRDAARALPPGASIYLEGLGEELFFSGFTDTPFRLLGLHTVRITPREAASIETRGRVPSLDPYTAPATIVRRSALAGRAAVLRLEGARLMDITQRYLHETSGAPESTPSRIDLGDPTYAYLLGPGWHALENGYRWTSRRAHATIGVPAQARELRVRGFCSPVQLAGGPLHLTVRAGEASQCKPVASCSGPFELNLPLPSVSGPLPVELAVDRAQPIPPDDRELGLAIQWIEAR